MKFTLTKPKAVASPALAAAGAPSGAAAAGGAAAIAMPSSRRQARAESTVSETKPVKDARSTASRKPPRAPRQPKGALRIGGEPRVDLLPPEVRVERFGAVKVRRAWFGVVGVVALVAIATGGASLYASHAKSDLSNAQAQTSALSVEQQKYVAVRTAQEKVSLYRAAQSVAGSTDVDWSTYLGTIQATFPAGVTTTNLTISSASPLSSFAQASTPLQGVRVATVTFTATSQKLPSVPTWLDALKALPGYVDASAGSVTSTASAGDTAGSTASSGGYTVDVTLHLNQDIFSKLYTTEGK